MGAVRVHLKHWGDHAACRGSDYEFVPHTETETGAAEAAAAWCNTCPVRDECLTTAVQNGWQGYWGGTSTASRNRLRAPKNRAKCPICKSVNVVTLEESQACIACGRSWRKASPPVVKTAAGKRPSETAGEPATEEVKIMGDAL